MSDNDVTDKRPKRRRTVPPTDNSNSDDDFESQPTITRWLRRVPGPLQDVIKEEERRDGHAGHSASANGSAFVPHIKTEFDDGPWVELCQSRGIPTTVGALYGGVKMSQLKATVVNILGDELASPKIPQLLLLIKSMRYVDEEIVAVFHDPTGEIDGYFHRDIVEQLGPALTTGTAVALRDVSVFAPTVATAASSTNQVFLNIIPRNLEQVVLSKTLAVTQGHNVDAFNAAQAELLQSESAESANIVATTSKERRLLQNAVIRNTSSELSFISQRQVIHRNPPVKPTTSEESVTGKSKKKDKSAAAASASGIGRWQWNKLIPTRPRPNDNEDDHQNDRTTSRSNSVSMTNMITRRAKTSKESKSQRHRVTFASNTDENITLPDHQDESSTHEVVSQAESLAGSQIGIPPAPTFSMKKRDVITTSQSKSGIEALEQELEDDDW